MVSIMQPAASAIPRVAKRFRAARRRMASTRRLHCRVPEGLRRSPARRRPVTSKPIEDRRLMRRAVGANRRDRLTDGHVAFTGLHEFEIARRRCCVAFAKIPGRRQGRVRRYGLPSACSPSRLCKCNAPRVFPRRSASRRCRACAYLVVLPRQATKDVCGSTCSQAFRTIALALSRVERLCATFCNAQFAAARKAATLTLGMSSSCTRPRSPSSFRRTR